MKETELRKHANCSVCRKPIMHTGLPLFWTVKIERFGIKMNIVKRQDGLAAFLGSSHLAQIMGTDEEMTEPMMDAAELTLCEKCAMEEQCIAALAELSSMDEGLLRDEPSPYPLPAGEGK